ncbi:MAG: response regulator [Pseudomonadota bacterium]
MRVLLVDDEKELVTTMAERLFLRGIDADWATSGEEALRRIEAGVYDIAVLDVKIPKISGLKLKKILQEKCPEMKFIFLTGHGSEEDYKAGLAEAGADYYLVKPVNIETLVERMKEVLKK